MKITIYLLIPLIIFFEGCSGCSEDEIPTSSNRDTVQIETLKSIHKKADNSYEDKYNDNLDEELKYKKELPFPTFPNQQISDNYQERDNQQIGDEVDSDNVEQSTNNSSFKDVSSNQNREITPLNKTSQDYSDYEKQLANQMEEAMKNYPRPPSPANLTPYDDREGGSYRKPTKEETQNGTGEFPPIPPAMFLNN